MSEPSFTLTIELSRDDNDKIINKLKQSIAIVRRFADAGEYLVVCAAFQPFGPTNTVQFSGPWNMFASQKPIEAGVVVTPQVWQPAHVGDQYIFMQSGFGSHATAYSEAVFGFDNQSTHDPISFGLAQTITVNDAASMAALAVMPAPSQMVSYLEPLSEACIFLATGMQNNALVPAAMLQPAPMARAAVSNFGGSSVGKYLTVDLTQNPTIYFDSAYKRFTLTQPASSS